MIKYIEQLFIDYGFQQDQIDSGALFSRPNNDPKEEFWLVITTDDLKALLDKQGELFTEAKKSQTSPALNKNISLLVLWETSGKLGHEERKKKLMRLEEDASFFKKYVLYYSKSEAEALSAALKNKPLKGFLKDNITSQEIFDKYKTNQNNKSTWHALLYRIAIKIHFINIEIEKAEKMESLIEDNEEAIKKSNIEDLDLFNLRFFALDLNDLLSEEKEPENLLDALIGEPNAD